MLPGEPTRDVKITIEGYDTVTVGGEKRRLSRYVVDGVVWGKETVWLDEADRFAAIVSRIHILPLEGVRADLKDALPALQASAAKARIGDLALMPLNIRAFAEEHSHFVGARLIDGTGRAAVEDSVVVVRDGRITAAGPRASTPIPPGRACDRRAAAPTIAPGLWDMHAHAAHVEWMPAYLAAGVTTIRDMGGETPYLFAMRDHRQRHGDQAARASCRPR